MAATKPSPARRAAPVADASESRPKLAKRFRKLPQQWSPRGREMLESPAYRVLSLSAHRALSRIEIELASHAGNDNGRLPVTYADFADYGIDRHSIAPAIRELEALGFITFKPGAGGNAEWRQANLFGLTFRHGDHDPATDDWRNIKTVEEAEARARAARMTPVDRPRRRKQKTGGGKHHVSVGETHTR